MASNLSTRAVRSACTASKAAPRSLVTLIPRRSLTSTPESSKQPPRWSYTPPRTMAPFRLRFDSGRPEYNVNADPAVLDQFYIRMLGEKGDQVLSDELKWLAVTHKSFDQGRRGFNDRLAFLGKRIVQVQASLALVQNPSTASTTPTKDDFGRTPFTHPALDGLKNLSGATKGALTDRTKLAELAQRYKLLEVLRWAPKTPGNLRASGSELVLAHTLYAIIGAISLEKGGHVANQVARERILKPLGF
ncbi:hypothetical protein N7492_000187 [Penicillium capsulatum]|uniref:RNase III domain-containing protein n=1 Tax=Penicillium capsulatum TaxID=69766 RepID=A0A9W9ISA9_9EURO|nr:hypothetical protein N7492_000187 [Penicillium capsulatum]KAJ6130748.1 hypothetical protein N7512_003528 [Penicillium capsulatum]